MKPIHIVILCISSLAVVGGIFIKLRYQTEAGLFLRDVGLGGLIVFIIIFYKHLKSKNETTSK